MKPRYHFTSTRLGFRSWEESDLEAMTAINQDPEVMAYFPKTYDQKDTAAFITRMQEHESAHGFCYFAVETLDNSRFIGFIGLMHQSYPAFFTPCVDIGWRLHRQYWNKGFATEGAKACLDLAFSKYACNTVFAVAPKVNVPSERVMMKIGMKRVDEFLHPMLSDFQSLQPCVVYIAEQEQTYI
jgi:RimJ/RimL family protein N-acetyltransferase